MQQRLIGSVSKIRSVYKIYATCNVPLRDNDLNLSTTHQTVHVYTWMHQLISDNFFYLTIKGNILVLTILKNMVPNCNRFVSDKLIQYFDVY